MDVQGGRQLFEQEWWHLRDEVLALGSLVERAIIESVDILERCNAASLSQLGDMDRQISKGRFAIEMDCVKLIVTRQWLGRDLRVITSTLEVAAELERMGACVADSARMPSMIIEDSLHSLVADLRCLATKTQAMLHQALEAFGQRDLAMAHTIPAEQGVVQTLYDQIYRELLTLMSVKAPTTTHQARYLSRVARNLERVAERTTRICAWIVFAITGTMPPVRAERAQRVSKSPFFQQQQVVSQEC
jgi:phosphate transport system protein